jgi:nucleoside-diphosphate-sugar epimerase
VHASTCSVYGRASGELIGEETPCAPASAYDRTKHAVEGILQRHAQGRYELVILRPTAVFGPGGRNLESLAHRVLRQSWPRRYLRACAMDRRHMHTVDVECVAGAAVFAAAAPLKQPLERFIVSQDDEPGNDYASIEEFFVRRFGATRYPLSPLPLPVPLMRWALRLAGRSDAEPHRLYSAAKLAQRGFMRPRPFGAALEEYAGWIERHARP